MNKNTLLKSDKQKHKGYKFLCKRIYKRVKILNINKIFMLYIIFF